MCYENLDVLRLEHQHLYGVFDYFLFNAFYAREIMVTRFPKVPSLMIPWGSTLAPKTAKRARTPGGPLRLVHVAGWGGHNKRKNTDLLIRAFHEADLDGVELHIFTQAPISKYGEECQSIVDVDQRLKVHQGTIQDIGDAYRGMDMLVWPSKREGLGLPIVEALASGLPVMTTDGYMMKQWIIPEEHGFFCPATPTETEMFLPEMQVDPATLIDRLHQIALDPDKLSHLRTNVERDRRLWIWSWQRKTFQDQLRRIAEDRDYSPPEDLSYIPHWYLAFESRRKQAECDSVDNRETPSSGR
jgi:glycosyltransferase involved in cell wall biosynthesis